MKGIIIARNDQEALLPLTEHTSKPMLNFFDQPLISHSIGLMKQHGIQNICVIAEEENESLKAYVTTVEGVSYLLLPKQGVCVEELAQSHEDCVLFGALTVTDFDLQKLFSYHKSKPTPVTAVYPKAIKDRHAVLTDEDGNLLECHGVLEKEGIYFLKQEAYHFSIRRQKELLPSFLEQKLAVCLLYESGCYSNLSTIKEYLQLSAEILDDKQFLSQYREPNGVILKENTFLEIGSKIKPPVYIGENVSVSKNAEILPYSVICSNTIVCESAKISHSVISEHCRIEANATVTGALLAQQVTAGENARISAGSVYGQGTHISAGKNLLVKETSGQWSNLQFGAHGILLPLENPNEFLFCLGQVCGVLFETGIQGIFKDDSTKAQFFSHSLHAGLQSVGISLYEFPECTLAMCKSACPFYRLKAGFYLYETKETVAIIIVDSDGNAISREMEETIREAMKHPPKKSRSTLHKTAFVKPYQLYYITEITRRLEAKSAPCVLYCDTSSPTVLEYLQKVATGHKVTLLSQSKPGVIRFQCNPSATEFTIFDEAGHALTPRQIEAIIAALLIWEKESAFVTTRSTPQAICRYLEQHSVTPRETDAHPHNIDVALGQIPAQYYLWSDPVYLMMKILLYLTEHSLTLSHWVSTLPKSFLIEKTITVEDHLTDAINELLKLAQDKTGPQEKSYRFHSKKGITTVTKENNSFTVLSESDREEYAKELTDFYVGQFMKESEKQ